MYQAYWKLKLPAFDNGLDHRFFFLSAAHEEALSRLKYVIEGRKSIGLLTGDYGVGKTQLVRELWNRLNGPGAQLAYIGVPQLSLDEILDQTVRAFAAGNPQAPASGRANLLRVLEDILHRNVEIGRRTAILVDDAHLVKDPNAFEELRSLLNLSFASDAPLMSLILVGQTELRERIGELPQFRQRVSFPYHLGPLAAEEVARYLEHRLRVSGAEAPGRVFSADGAAALAEVSKGNPRVINSLAEAALLCGAMRKAQAIDAAIVAEVRSEVWA